MKQKLTLSLDKEVIENAKKYAKEEGTSVSNLVENYLRLIIQDESVKRTNITIPDRGRTLTYYQIVNRDN